jgi:hypothetical protein
MGMWDKNPNVTNKIKANMPLLAHESKLQIIRY